MIQWNYGNVMGRPIDIYAHKHLRIYTVYRMKKLMR